MCVEVVVVGGLNKRKQKKQKRLPQVLTCRSSWQKVRAERGRGTVGGWKEGRGKRESDWTDDKAKRSVSRPAVRQCCVCIL